MPAAPEVASAGRLKTAGDADRGRSASGSGKLYPGPWVLDGTMASRNAMSQETSAPPNEEEVASALVRRIAAGDRGAEGEMVERYSRGISFLLRRLTGSTELAQDLHQETFRIVLERLRGRGLEDPAGLAAFLRGTARHLAVADRRKVARRRTEADDEALAEIPHPAPSQLSSVLLAEEAAAVRELIHELPTERDRELLLRFYVADEEKDSICNALGLDRLHFNRVVFRARQRFKDLFERRLGAAAMRPSP